MGLYNDLIGDDSVIGGIFTNPGRVGSALVDTGKDMVTNPVGFVQNNWDNNSGSSASTVSNVSNDINQGIGSIGSGLGGTVNNVTGGIGNSIGGISSSVNNAVGGIGNTVGGISNSIGDATSGISNTVGNVTGGIGNAVGGISNTVGGIGSSIGDATSGISSGLNSVSSGIGDAVGSVSSGLNSATGFVGSAASSVENMASSGISSIATPLGSIVGKGESMVGGAVSAVSNLAGSAVDGVSGAVSNLTSGLFGKSNVAKKAAKLNTKTADALKATTAKGTPRQTAFKMNGSFSQTDPINLKVKKPALGGALSSLSNLSNRFGGLFNSAKGLVSGAENGIMGAVNDVTHSSLVQGVLGGVTGVMGAVSDVRSGVNNAMSMVTSIPRSLESSLANEWKKFSIPISNAVNGVPNSLDDFYDSKLLGTTDADGNPVDGVPSNMGLSQLSSYYNMAKNLGCELAHPSVFANSAQQSLRGSLLGIASTFDMHDLLKGLTTCPQFGFAMQNYGKGLFQGLFSHKVKSAAIVGNALPVSMQPLTPTLAKAAVTNSDVNSSDKVDAVKSTFDHFQVSTVAPYTNNNGTGQNGKAQLTPQTMQKLNSMTMSRPVLLVDGVVTDEKSGPTNQELITAASLGGAVKTSDGLASYQSLQDDQLVGYGVNPTAQTNADPTKVTWQDTSDIVDATYLDNNLTSNTVQDSTTSFLTTNKSNLPVLFSERSTTPTYADVAKAYYNGGGVLTQAGFVSYTMLGITSPTSPDSKSLTDKTVLSWSMGNNNSGQYVVDMPIIETQTTNGVTTNVTVFDDSVISNSYSPLVTAMTGNGDLVKTIGGTAVS